MASAVPRSAWIGAAALLLALAALLYVWAPGSGELSSATETPAPHSALPAQEDSPGTLAPPAAAPAETEDIRDTIRVSGSASPSSPSSSESAPAGGDAGGDRIQERYDAAQAERAAIKAAANRKHRKLNVKERVAYWEVEARLIDAIGVQAYDQLLYDNGRKNRSRVNYVGPGSNAGQAGIQNGDVLVSYGGEPAFGPRSVRESNRLFEPGEQVVVVVRRRGEILEFLVDADHRKRGRSGIVNGMTLIPFAVEP